MPRERKAAPKGTVGTRTMDPRLELEKEWDKRNPEFKHVWKSKGLSPGTRKDKAAEIVRDADSNIVESGNSVLCRIPKDTWLAKPMHVDEQSVEMMKSIRSDDGKRFIDKPLRQYRNPKSPIQPEE